MLRFMRQAPSASSAISSSLLRHATFRSKSATASDVLVQHHGRRRTIGRNCPAYACRRRATRAALSTAAAEAVNPRSYPTAKSARPAIAPHQFDSPAAKNDGRHHQTEIRRITHLRNVGVLAHVDAGKTTVTERMLAHTGIIHAPGTVDSGNTVTDFLPAERERGITIQSAAISFEWKWHSSPRGDDYDANDAVQIHLIDTPGHVDFSVEVNRSVAVLDGAVLVVDAVAGVQAQTETVWRAMTRPWISAAVPNNHEDNDVGEKQTKEMHEPLPCLCLVNKMDKEGSQFCLAVQSLKKKLPGANPIPMHIPLFRKESASSTVSKSKQNITHADLFAVPMDDNTTISSAGQFMGVIDLLHMRTIVWPNVTNVSNVDECTPTVTHLLTSSHEPRDPDCPITDIAAKSRSDLVAKLADVDDVIAEHYLLEEEPSNAELREALRRATLHRRALPVMAGAALKGKGVEPVLDAVADLLPSPLDRMPPALIVQEGWGKRSKKKAKKQKQQQKSNQSSDGESVMNEEKGQASITLGHPLHPSLLAMAFKVIHMKGRGGSGDGRVVFARVYSGKLRAKDTVKCITPSLPGDDSATNKPRTERIGAMLELAGGRFDNLDDGMCRSGDVCALVGLKSVVTGDTILGVSDVFSGKKKKKSSENIGNVCLAGVASPKPVLTVRLEAESTEEQSRLSSALVNLAIEDPSLVVKETESATLLSGLGELHIEVTIDRLRREFGLQVTTGPPSVAYRETVREKIETENGMYNYDRTIGGTRLQASVHLILEPAGMDDDSTSASNALTLLDPTVVIGPEARQFLEVDDAAPEEELVYQSEVVRSLVAGIKGALRRGAVGPFEMGNVKCIVVNVDAEGGLSALVALPGSIRAAAANAVTAMVSSDEGKAHCAILEPTMSVEVTVPGSMVGPVLSDLNTRRGTIGDVFMGDEDEPDQSKALIRGDVPLVEILGYASSLRSLTGGEGAFTAEYKGHAPCAANNMIQH